MDDPQYNTKNSHVYYTNYVRNYRAVGVMWGIFTICFAIIAIVVFFQPQWIGDTSDSPGTGYFGLFEYCELFQTGTENLYCRGRFDEFSSILSTSFKAAAFFVGFAALMILLCICCMILFFFFSSSTVFAVCGTMQMISGFCMFLGCVIYPAGWDNEEIKRICGEKTGVFNIGDCGIRWSYILAIIGIFDAFILAILAFVLSSRRAKLLKPLTQDNMMTKSDIDGIMLETASQKPSMLIQPVMTVPGDGHENYSEYSHHSNKRGRKNDYML